MQIRPTGHEELYVSWDGREADFFEVRRSTSLEGPYEITATALSTPFFIDTDVNLHDPAIRYYYQVRGFVGGIEVFKENTEPGAAMYFEKDPISNVVIYESRKVLEVMKNPPVFILIKRRIGKPCPDCWNPITKKTKYANCPTCNGTGKLEGYYPPIPTRISREVSDLANNSSMLDGDRTSQSSINAWISNRPLVSPGDIIVDTTNQRFMIQAVVLRTKSSYVHRQILQLSPLEKGHPAYLVDVNFDVSPVFPKGGL